MLLFWFCVIFCLLIAGLFFIAPRNQLNNRTYLVTSLFCFLVVGSVGLYHQYGALNKVKDKERQDLIQTGYLDLQAPKGVLSSDIKKQLERHLQYQKNDRDILTLLSMDAYQHKQYTVAKRYWERLLKQENLTEQEIKAIRFMIEKARQEA